VGGIRTGLGFRSELGGRGSSARQRLLSPTHFEFPGRRLLTGSWLSDSLRARLDFFRASSCVSLSKHFSQSTEW